MESRVSVIIPNYNHAAYLTQRIESVLNQTLQPSEIIILDDCSTDNSIEVIEKYVSQHPQIYFIKNEQNSGSPFTQWNKGVALAKGDLIWIAESDDTSEITFLEKVSNAFITNPDIALAYSQSNKIDSFSSFIESGLVYTNEFDMQLFKKDFEMEGKEFLERFLIHRNIIPNGSAVIFKKEIFEKVKGATPHFKYQGDWLIWMQMLCYGKISFFKEPLNNFRIHKESTIAIGQTLIKENQFNDWFAYKIRLFFQNFINENNLFLSKNILRINANYISIDRGNYGLYNLGLKKYIKAWKLILKASFSPSFKTGFIKKAIKMTTK